MSLRKTPSVSLRFLLGETVARDGDPLGTGKHCPVCLTHGDNISQMRFAKLFT